MSSGSCEKFCTQQKVKSEMKRAAESQEEDFYGIDEEGRMGDWFRTYKRIRTSKNIDSTRRRVEVKSKDYSNYIRVHPLREILQSTEPQEELEDKLVKSLLPEIILHVLEYALPVQTIQIASEEEESQTTSVKELFGRFSNGHTYLIRKNVSLPGSAAVQSFRWLLSQPSVTARLTQVSSDQLEAIDSFSEIELSSIVEIQQVPEELDESLTELVVNILKKSPNVRKYDLTYTNDIEDINANKLAQEIAKIHKLVEVSLDANERFEGQLQQNSWKISWETFIQMISERTNYTSLKVVIPDGAMPAKVLELLPKLEKLERFHLSASLKSDELLKVIFRLTTLKDLMFSVPEDGTVDLSGSGLSQLLNLEKLRLEGRYLDNSTDEINNLPKLKHLILTGAEGIDTEVLKIINNNKTIEELELLFCGISDENVLTVLPNNTTLKKLTILEPEEGNHEEFDATIWSLLDRADSALDNCSEHLELIVATSFR